MNLSGKKNRRPRARSGALLATLLTAAVLPLGAGTAAQAATGPVSLSDVRAESTPNQNRAVVQKGKTFTHVVTLHTELKKKVKVWVRIGGSCVVANGKVDYWTDSLRKVTVPAVSKKGFNSTAKSRVVSFTAKVTVPQKCWTAYEARGGKDVVAWARTSLFWSKPKGSGGLAQSTALWPGKALTSGNARSNLARIIRPVQGKVADYAVHRTLPATYAKKFTKVGLNVHDPRWTQWWCKRPSYKNRFGAQQKAYNAEWKKFFKKTPKPSLHQVLQQQRMMHHFWGPKYTCR